MNTLISNEIREKLASYPKHIRPLLINLRRHIIETAKTDKIDSLTEALKWGQPSYLAKNGSTIRLDWSEKTPNQYYLYFTCSTKLIETFREIYPNVFDYQGNRAIIFQLDEEINIKILSHCISMSLNYHKLKKFPLLGN